MPKLTGSKEYTDVQLAKIHDAYAETYFYQATMPDGTPNPVTKAEFAGDIIDGNSEGIFNARSQTKRQIEVIQGALVQAISDSEGDDVL